MKWQFITLAAPHHNGCAEVLVKSCKIALKKAVGDHLLAWTIIKSSSSRTVQTDQEPSCKSGICPEDCRFILEPLDKRCVPVTYSTKEMEYRDPICAS